MKLLPLLCLALLLPASVHATTRNSANNLYTITADTVDLGGVRTTSPGNTPTYTNVGGAGTVGGVSSGSTAYTARAGYSGQSTEVVSLSASSASSSIAQNTGTQLSATATLDDGTTAVLLGTDLARNPVAYPFATINTLGQLVAANVYVASVGTVTLSYLGASATVSVQVTGGPYAGGIIPDSWFYQYFGAAPNPAAAPGNDADGTGQTNLFKYLAGLNPINGSRFALSIASVPGQPGMKMLVYTPIYSGRTYTPQYSTSLTSPSWQTLTNLTTSDNGTTRTVTDLGAGSAPRFYRVQISMP